MTSPNATDRFPYPIQDADHLKAGRRALEALQEFTERIEKQHAAVSPSVPSKEPHLFPPVADEEPEPTLRVTPDI